MSLLLRLRDTHGIEATYYCILNEAGNGNSFSSSVVCEDIKALGPRMAAKGLSTTIEFPECADVNKCWQYITDTQGDDEMWSYVGLVSYHLYFGTHTDTTVRPQMRDFAWAKGLPTGQTEFMGLTTTILYEDLILGGVSYWEIYGIGSQIDWWNHYNSLARTGWYWSFRQVLHYVRPGAVRVDVTSSDLQLRPLAFVKDGKTIVVLINDLDSTARTVDLNGLTPGTYGICQSVNKATYQELGLQTVGVPGTLTVDVPGNAVLTVHPHPGTNQPPTVTDFKASPEYLGAAADSATLSASAQDPELDPISYLWAIRSKPAAASVTLGTPDAASTPATGLSVAGDYVFTVSVSDSSHTVTRDVRLRKYAVNQPPIPDDVHNRIPVVLTLPTSSTQLRGGGWDLEGDPLTFQWHVVSQPNGANVSITKIASNRWDATNMTVAGDYHLRFEVNDGTNKVYEDLTITVYPANQNPTIPSATATPSNITLPTSSTSLSATTSDPDGDVISHWWSVKSAPAGAEPVFASQGARDTAVSGLIVDGTYVFMLTVVDRAGYTTKDVTVTVDPGTGSPLFNVTWPSGGEAFKRGQKVDIRWTSANFVGDVKLELFDGASWSAIAASTADDGGELWTVPDIDATGCKVRVSDAGDGDPADESDGVFTIGTPAGVGDGRGRSSCVASPPAETTGPPVQMASLVLALAAWHVARQRGRSSRAGVRRGE